MSDEEAQQIDVQFAAERDTKNTVRFKEYVPFGADPKVGIIYIPKATLEKLGFPERIRITIEPDDTTREPRGRLGEEKPYA
jgi:hypothetical protein